MSFENTGRYRRTALVPAAAILLAATIACAGAVPLPPSGSPAPPTTAVPTGPPTVAATSPATSTSSPAATPTTGATTHTFVAAGRIARCDHPPTRRTAALVEQLVEDADALVLTLGDHAYPGGRLGQFERCYDPTWGRFRGRTHPVPGNHDYLDPGAAGYFAYFGDRAGEPGRGWYAFDAGYWRLYGLNSECDEIGGCTPGSAQYEWLRDDLGANSRACSLAFWHRPVFASGRDGGQDQMAAILGLLHEHGVDIVLTGDDHLYERLALADPAGRPDSRGVRMFNVGTGGSGLQPLERPPLPITDVRDASIHGVLRLDLAAGAYRWQFRPTRAGGFADTGEEECR